MKKLYLFIPLFIGMNCGMRAQSEFKPKAKNVDSIVSTLKLSAIRDLDLLADTLTSSFASDSEKVRAIYYWLEENISYDWRYYKQVCSLTSIHLPKGMDYEDWKFMRMEKTIARKKGICGDYANLFTYLCTRAKVPSVVVSGYGATHRVSILMVFDPEETDHAWNSVKINDKWYLMDVCWASGKIAKRKRKINSGRNDFYYLTPPEEFIKNHHPAKNNWQLLTNTLSIREFIKIANKEIKTKVSWYRYWTPF